jgi:hypothetical protein
MAQGGNWRLCFWVTFAVEVVLLIYFCIFFEESKYIMHIDAQVGQECEPSETPVTKKTSVSEDIQQTATASSYLSNTGNKSINSNIPVLTYRERLRLITKTDESLLKSVYQPFIILFRFPAVMYTALQYAFCLCWISAQASVISIAFTQPPYNFGTVGVGNMSLGIFIGNILGSIYGGVLSDRSVRWFARRNYGFYEPEMRLHLNHLPALCVGSGIIMFGVTTAKASNTRLLLDICADMKNRACTGYTQALAAQSSGSESEASVTSRSVCSSIVTRR